MITPPTECFYVVQVDGEAAEFVAATLSLSTISDIEQAGQLGIKYNELKVMEDLWPAPITFIANASRETPEYLHRGMNSLALRVPIKNSLRTFIAKVGPIISTSANTQGEKPIDSVTKAKKTFGERLDFYVDVGRLEGEPSTIIKLTNNKIEVLRQGAYRFNSDEIGKKI